MILFSLTMAGMVVALGWLYAILLGCQAWESRRFARGRQQLPLPDENCRRVALYVPCKGYDLQLADNLKALFKQDYANYELVFVVESDRDAACATIHDLMARRPDVPARLVVAGQSTDSGQKVHNLLVATAEVPERVQILAFADSDARPHPAWLSRLVSGLDKDGVGATTGYRWLFPLRNRLANFLLYSI
ncbi:MAG: glycosyltransferase, partial [Planctomycetales bacterium]|nr:glycosyltransferase [Planctomycetales bacterium]